MSPERRDEWIVVTEDAKTIPVIEILTGRGFVTGKSGSGKSNTGGVIAEELLESGYNILIIDTEGEYFGLKERYELLHVGADEFADVQVGPGHAKKIAEVALKRNMPIILDVSGYFDGADADEMIKAVLEHLYRLEKEERKPFLVMIEEMQEYLPQKGGGTELAQLIERIAKRGRKRGLGLCGMSQRPSSVDKDFITQCDWMVWHRLTWETDINVVRNILGADRASDIQEFDPGEGILMTDWDDTIETVQFKRKRTHDAGATPGLEQYDRPDLQTVGAELIQEIKGKGASADFSREASPDTAASPDPEPPAPEPEEEPPADEPPTNDAPTEEAPADTPDEDLAAVELEPEPEPEPSAEPSEPVPEADADTLVAERRRNELLNAEIEELRAILEGVEGEREVPTLPEAPDDVSGPALEPPSPPRRPRNQSGLAGSLVEFCQMLLYLAKSAWYRVRLHYHYR